MFACRQDVTADEKHGGNGHKTDESQRYRFKKRLLVGREIVSYELDRRRQNEVNEKRHPSNPEKGERRHDGQNRENPTDDNRKRIAAEMEDGDDAWNYCSRNQEAGNVGKVFAVQILERQAVPLFVFFEEKQLAYAVDEASETIAGNRDRQAERRVVSRLEVRGKAEHGRDYEQKPK